MALKKEIPRVWRFIILFPNSNSNLVVLMCPQFSNRPVEFRAIATVSSRHFSRRQTSNRWVSQESKEIVTYSNMVWMGHFYLNQRHHGHPSLRKNTYLLCFSRSSSPKPRCSVLRRTSRPCFPHHRPCPSVLCLPGIQGGGGSDLVSMVANYSWEPQLNLDDHAFQWFTAGGWLHAQEKYNPENKVEACNRWCFKICRYSLGRRQLLSWSVALPQWLLKVAIATTISWSGS